MSKDELLQQFVTLARNAVGDNLESVVLYGSTVRGDAQAPYSDLNLLCVLRSTSRAELEKMATLVNWWSQGQGQRSPLIFTADELRRSADVFAIELIDMQRAHRVLYGAVIISDIPVPMNLHRVQVEHELRTLIQKLRQHYLHGPAEETNLRTALAKSFSSAVTLLRHTLIAMDHDAPTDRHEVLIRCISIWVSMSTRSRPYWNFARLQTRKGASDLCTEAIWKFWNTSVINSIESCRRKSGSGLGNEEVRIWLHHHSRGEMKWVKRSSLS